MTRPDETVGRCDEDSASSREPPGQPFVGRVGDKIQIKIISCRREQRRPRIAVGRGQDRTDIFAGGRIPIRGGHGKPTVGVGDAGQRLRRREIDAAKCAVSIQRQKRAGATHDPPFAVHAHRPREVVADRRRIAPVPARKRRLGWIRRRYHALPAGGYPTNDERVAPNGGGGPRERAARAANLARLGPVGVEFEPHKTCPAGGKSQIAGRRSH